MKKLAILIIALVFVTLSSATLFAGKQPDIAFHADMYKYDIISGKVTDINPFTIEIEGEERTLCHEQHTQFFRGDGSVAIEKVYGGDLFKDCEKITSSQIKEGDNLKARFTKVGKNAVCLEVVLIVK
jgi:hypothetical protein